MTETTIEDYARLRAAAAAIANERGGRHGLPPIANVLDLLPQKLLDEVLEDARAALEAAGYERVHVALQESLKLQSHYAELLNMHDGGARRGFPDVASWLARLDEVKRAGEGA